MTVAAMQQDHGRASPEGRVPDPRSIVLDVALIICVWQRHAFGLEYLEIVIVDFNFDIAASRFEHTGSGERGRARTCNRQLRRLMLYPIELLARVLHRNASIHCNGLLREVEILQAANLATHRERYSPVKEKNRRWID